MVNKSSVTTNYRIKFEQWFGAEGGKFRNVFRVPFESAIRPMPLRHSQPGLQLHPRGRVLSQAELPRLGTLSRTFGN